MTSAMNNNDPNIDALKEYLLSPIDHHLGLDHGVLKVYKDGTEVNAHVIVNIKQLNKGSSINIRCNSNINKTTLDTIQHLATEALSNMSPYDRTLTIYEYTYTPSQNLTSEDLENTSYEDYVFVEVATPPPQESPDCREFREISNQGPETRAESRAPKESLLRRIFNILKRVFNWKNPPISTPPVPSPVVEDIEASSPTHPETTPLSRNDFEQRVENLQKTLNEFINIQTSLNSLKCTVSNGIQRLVNMIKEPPPNSGPESEDNLFTWIDTQREKLDKTHLNSKRAALKEAQTYAKQDLIFEQLKTKIELLTKDPAAAEFMNSLPNTDELLSNTRQIIETAEKMQPIPGAPLDSPFPEAQPPLSNEPYIDLLNMELREKLDKLESNLYQEIFKKQQSNLENLTSNMPEGNAVFGFKNGQLTICKGEAADLPSITFLYNKKRITIYVEAISQKKVIEYINAIQGLDPRHYKNQQQAFFKMLEKGGSVKEFI